MKELLKKIRESNILLELVDGELQVFSNNTNISSELILEIKKEKNELTQFLLNNDQLNFQDSFKTNIPVISNQSSYPLSSAQRRLWVLSQFEESNIAYNIPGVYVFEGNVDEAALKYCFSALIERHEILRTIFKQNDEGEIRQFIQSIQEIEFKIGYQDLRYEKEQEEKIQQIVKEEFTKSFNLTRGPLLRAGLYQTADDQWIFTCVMHHIISDGWSMNILIKELLSFYNAYTKKEDNPLTPLRIQYKDYAAWQQEQLRGEQLQSHKTYWLEQFTGELPVLEMPTDKPRQAVKTYNGSSVHKTINSELSKEIKSLSQEQGCTLFMGLLAAVNTLLYRYTGQEDIIIGSPIAGRGHADIEDQIGFYVNTLALRIQFKGEDNYKQVLGRVKQITLSAYEHQVYPFDELVDELDLQRDMSRSPLFDVMVVLQNNETQQIQGLRLGEGEAEVKEYMEVDNQTSAFDLGWNFAEVEEAIELTIVYNTDIYNKNSIERLANHLEQLLQAIIANPHTSINQLDYLTEKEKQQLLIEFNDTVVDYPQNKTIVDLFEEQVEKTPHNVAVVFEEKELTYQQLNEKSNQLASYLRTTYKIKPDDLIGIQLERNEWMIIAILAALKSGGAYVPIDPEYPQERIDYMLADSKCKVVIDEKELEKFKNEQNKYNKNNIKQIDKPSDLAYVIYTSGSTGKPKGVLVNHSNLHHFFEHIHACYITPTQIIQPFIASNAFDISLFQLFMPLLSGGKSILVTKEQLQDIPQFLTLLQQVNTIDTVPAVYTSIVNHIIEHDLSDDFKHINQLFIGGDSISDNLLYKLSDIFSSAIITVTYGPTEGTIFCTQLMYKPNIINHEVKGSIIGQPISNTNIYILDEQQQLQPLGVIGEISISGAGVVRGYFNQSALTEEKFVPNPFKNGERMYKTGDLGRWLPDGNIEFMGRKDDQVKIRGYRIELGEIEKNLEKHEDINRVIIISKKDVDGNKQLIAYVEKKKRVKLYPSTSEFFVYDDLLYYALTTNEKRNGHYIRTFNKLLKDKIILDLGTGPDAILSQFCIAAGAQKVYAVEILKETYDKAKKCIDSLGLTNKIILIHGDITKIELPEKVDYCVSEIVGSIGGSEGAAKLINEIRRLLKDPANMLPKRSLTKIAAVYLPDELHQYTFDGVGDHYIQRIFNQVGYEFDVRICVENFPLENVITNHQPFEDLDFTNPIKLEDEHIIELKFNKDSIVNGFIVWLNLYIDESELIDSLSEHYNWLPIYLPVFYHDTKISKGDYIKAKIERKLANNGLNPDFTISGTLYRKNDNSIDFSFKSSNHEKRYRSNIFYQKLFENDTIKIKEDISVNSLKTYLKDRLPIYMLPTYYVQLDELPLTPNGKIDKKALPDPEGLGLSSGVEYVAPRNETEEKLVEIWQEILSKEKIGIKDNFFELGGHSLKATRLSSQIYKQFEVKLALKDLFQKPVLKEQAQLIQQDQKTSFITIPSVTVQSSYPLSSSQRRLWVLSQFEEGSIAYNMPGVHVFEGSLDVLALEQAFNRLIERHEILRTAFKENEQGEVRQFIQPIEEISFKIGYQDLRYEQEQEQKIQRIVKEEFTKSFNLTTGPLLRAGLYQTADNKWIFTYTMHHIISDGWSMNILIKDLLILYNAQIKGESHPLIPLRIQYKDYTAWQREQLSGEQLQKHKNYWLEQFAGELPVLEMPTDKRRPVVKTYNGGTIQKTINKNLTEGIKVLSQEQGATLFMGLLAAVNTLLYRYTGQEDIVIGTPIAGREHADLEDQIGFYVNTLALRSQFKGTDNFKDVLKNIKQITLGAYEHQIYPFDKLVDDLNLQRDMSRSPLFDVMVVLQNNEIQQIEEWHLEEIAVKEYREVENQISKFDLIFAFIETEKALQLNIEYNSDIYNKDTIERLANHLEQLLQAIIEQPLIPLNRLEYLSEAEKYQLLVEFNDTIAYYPKDKTIIDLFEEQVQKTPGNIALLYENKELTYKELNEKSNQLASYLRTIYKIKPNDLIGVQLERSEWLIIAILGILKSGGAYVPIDHDYPQERIDYMLADSKCKVVINERELEKSRKKQADYAKKDLKLINKPNDLAYIIYTSGSTGQPKGVMIEHQNVYTFISWCKQEFSTSAVDTVFAVTSICFDLSIFEIFHPLTNGKKLRILNDGLAIPKYINTTEKILINTVPSVIGALLNNNIDFSSVTVLNMAGEPIPSTYIKNLEKNYKNIEIRNLYGPSEDTTYSAVYKIKDSHTILIGQPIANTEIYITDEKLRIQPIGVLGEICISGAGLARGYLNRPDLTAEKFISNPFKQGERMYRTGDVGRWLTDGNIEYIGRKDDQVKIRGYRIELGEIEASLQKHPSIGGTVVVAKVNAQDEKELVAYIVSKEELNTTDLRTHLSKTLPAYMLPNYFVQLDALPLTPNGKVNKKALPNPEELGLSSGLEYVAPSNETEEKLVQIWQEILGKEKIGIKDNFFELGGHSLKTTWLVSQIHKQFNVKLDLKDVFMEPTVEALAIKLNTLLWLKNSDHIEQEKYDMESLRF